MTARGSYTFDADTAAFNAKVDARAIAFALAF